MKHFIIISILSILVVQNVSAQTDKFTPSYSLGVKQGISSSTVGFSPGIAQGLTLGYTGGLVFNYQNEKNFALQIELNYSQKGWTEDLDTISNSYNRKLNYIELPFITQIVMGKWPKMKVYINLGTSFAYLLSEKESLEVNNELYRREYYEKELENKFDYSGLGELGLKLNTEIGQFQVGVRYQMTFTDLFDNTEETVFYNSQNQLLNFSITYFFHDNRN